MHDLHIRRTSKTQSILENLEINSIASPPQIATSRSKTRFRFVKLDIRYATARFVKLDIRSQKKKEDCIDSHRLRRQSQTAQTVNHRFVKLDIRYAKRGLYTDSLHKKSSVNHIRFVKLDIRYVEVRLYKTGYH
jgi:hypothetical protein